MIKDEEIYRFAKLNRLKPHQQEKHYMQTATLSGVYSIFSDELVFKGGTALFFFYGLDRFSEDLDFTKTKQYDSKKFKTMISDFLHIINIVNELKTIKSIRGKTFKVKAQGPLYRGPLSECFITLEISDRNDIVLKPNIKEVIPIYDDLRPFTVPVMKKEEILAEKIRALMIRGKARDLYDIVFLIKKGTPIDYDLINEKLTYYEIKFNKDDFFRKASSIKNIWQSELQGLVPKVPNFDDSLNFVIEEFSN
jgi:predicted nucleotidyltransferase component of viral defense system